MPLSEYLDEWKKYFIDLEWIPLVKGLETWAHLHMRDDSGLNPIPNVCNC
jgi:hypothetical protein